jgi:hypothetical protein
MSGRQARGVVLRGAAATAAAIASALALQLAEVRAQGEDAPHDDAPREIARTASGFSIHATAAELPRLLSALGAEAGFTVVDTGKFQLPVTVMVENVPLDMVLRRLLRGANFIIVYRSGRRGTEISAEGIDQIVLLSPAGASGSPAPAVAAAGSPLAGPHVGSGAPGAPAPAVQAVQARRLRGPGGEDTAQHIDPATAVGEGGAPPIAVPGVPGMVGQFGGLESGGDPGALGMTGAVGAVEESQMVEPQMVEPHMVEPDDADLEDEEEE